MKAIITCPECNGEGGFVTGHAYEDTDVEQCERCQGKGIAELLEGDEASCPTCHGLVTTCLCDDEDAVFRRTDVMGNDATADPGLGD